MQLFLFACSLPLVGKLLGYRPHGTTAGYVHLADDLLVEEAEKVGSIIAAAINFSARSSTVLETVSHDSFQVLSH